MKSKHLFRNQAGVIHHIGLIIFAVVLVGVLGFAVYRIQNQDPNYGYADFSLDEDDSSQIELEEANDESDVDTQESDNELTQVTEQTGEEQ